jgi:hypothetical protein
VPNKKSNISIPHHKNKNKNGVVEASNKNVKKMIVTYKVYHEILLFALHGYRTIVKLK